MKSIFTSTLVLVILFLLAIPAKAQKGDYIITTKGDTLACTISAPWVGSMKYSIENTEQPKKISIKDIKEYYIAKKQIWCRKVYIPIGGKVWPVYLSVLESGRINLYEGIIHSSQPPNYSSTTQWYVAKGSDTTKLLKTSSLTIFMRSRGKRENDFAEMLSDNKELYNKFLSEKDFSFDAVRNYVHLYNTGYPATYEKSRTN